MLRLLSVLVGDFMYGRYQLYLFADIIGDDVLVGCAKWAQKWRGWLSSWLLQWLMR
jgi:hypothetical protein